MPVWMLWRKKKVPCQRSNYDLLVKRCGANGRSKLNIELGVAISVLALDHFLMLTDLS